MYYGHYRDSRREVLCIECLGEECDKCNEGMVTLPEDNEEHEFIPYHKRNRNYGIFNSYVWLKQYNMLPNEGGWIDQSAKFIKMVEWCDLVHNKWTAYNKARNEAIAKLSNQMGSMFGKK